MQRILLTSTLSVSGHKLPTIIPNIHEMNILCFPSAALAEEGHASWLPLEQRDVKKFCKSYSKFDLKNKSEQELRDALKGIDILYCTGGNTFCLLDYMRQINFKSVLNDFLNKDGIYLGSSAGSIVMGPDIGFVAPIDDVSLSSLRDYTGLNFIDFYIMPHSDQEKFLKPVELILEKLEAIGKKVIYLKDDQALWITDKVIRI